MNKILGFLIVGGVVYYIYNNTKKNATELGESLTFLPNDISIDTTHILNPKIYVKFEINNPTNQPFGITKVYGTVKNLDTTIATINNNELVKVAANGISYLNIQLNVNVLNLIEDIGFGYLSNTFVINGYAMSGLIKIPFNKVLTIKIPSF